MKQTKQNTVFGKIYRPVIFGGVIVSVLASMVMPLLAAPSDLTINKLDSDRATNEESPWSIAEKSGYVYEAEEYAGVLKVVNTASPNNPTSTFADGDFMYWPQFVERSGNYVYVSSNESESYSYNPNAMSRITAYSIADPANPVQVGTVGLSSAGLASCPVGHVGNMFATSYGLILDVACDYGGFDHRLIAVEASNPASLTIGGELNYASYGSQIYNVQVVGNDAYLYLWNNNFLYVKLNISSSAAITVTETPPKSFAGAPGFIASYHKVGNNLFGTYSSGSTILMDTINVSVPASPTVTATTVICDKSNGGFVDGPELTTNRLLTMCNEDMRILDVSNPTSVIVGGKSAVLDPGIATIGDNQKVYVGAGYANTITLQVFDASNGTTAPTFLGGKSNNPSFSDDTYMIVPPGSTTAFVMASAFPVVRTVDISNPANLRLTSSQFLTQNNKIISEYNAYDKSSFYTSADGNFIYLAEQYSANHSAGGYLTAINISNPLNITVASRTALSASDHLLTSTVVGNTWYVVNDTNIQTYQINSLTGAVTLQDTQAYTMPAGGQTWFARVGFVNNNIIAYFGVQQARSINAADPTNLGATQSVNLPALASYTGLSVPLVIGNHMLISEGGFPGRVYAIDATNPASMTVSSSVADQVLGGGQTTLQSNGAGQVIFMEYGGDMFAKLDVSNLNAISLTDTINDAAGLFPAPLDGYDGLWDGTTFIGNRAYGINSTSNDNMYSFDVTDFSNVKPLDVLAVQVPFWRPNTLMAHQGYMYIGGDDDYEVSANLSAYDLSNGDNPNYVGTAVHDYNDVYDTAAKGNYMYATRNFGGLAVYDISNPTFPLLIDEVGNLSNPADLKISGNYLYLADRSNGLIIYDISNPAAPVVVGSLNNSQFSGLDRIEVRNGYVYGLYDGNDEFVVINATNPAAPVTVAPVNDANFYWLRDIKIAGSKLYVSNAGDAGSINDSITVYDLTNPGIPSKVSQFVSARSTDDEGYGAIEVYNDRFAFVTVSVANVIDVVDFGSLSAPVLHQTIGGTKNDPSLQGVNDLELVGNRLYSISKRGQSLNSYGLVLGASTGGGGGGTTPTTPTIPLIPSVPALTKLYNTGTAGVLAVILIGLVSLAICVALLLVTRQQGRYKFYRLYIRV